MEAICSWKRSSPTLSASTPVVRAVVSSLPPLIGFGVDFGGFTCLDGQASVASDKDNIIGAIGTESERLDHTVHGVVAASSLRRVLEGFGERRLRYLEAVRLGRVRKLMLDLRGSPAEGLLLSSVTWGSAPLLAVTIHLRSSSIFRDGPNQLFISHNGWEQLWRDKPDI